MHEIEYNNMRIKKVGVMKVCKKCQKEFNDNLTFCPFCGAENADKKLTYFEKKTAKEQDKEFIISKASIQDEDAKNAKEISADNLTVKLVTPLKKAKLLSILKIASSAIALVMLLVIGFLVANMDINKNIKLFTIMGAFLLVAVCGSLLISEIYVMLAIKKIESEDFSLRKIYYMLGPVFCYGNNVYEINTNMQCDDCNEKMHVELKDDDVYLVCNKNREHICKITKDNYILYLKDKLSINNNWDIIKHRGALWNF